MYLQSTIILPNEILIWVIVEKKEAKAALFFMEDMIGVKEKF